MLSPGLWFKCSETKDAFMNLIKDLEIFKNKFKQKKFKSHEFII